MKSFQAPKNRSQKGSALFIILVAVALFGALSFTVMQIMRSGNPDAVGEEKARLYAEEILNYGRALRQGAQNTRITGGCSDKGISFESSIAGYTHSPVAADACKVFNEQGGAVNYIAPANEWLDLNYTPAPMMRGEWYFPANTCIPGVGSADDAGGCGLDGTDNESLIAILPYIKKAICVQINELLGVTNPSNNPPQETGDAWPDANTKFSGTMTDGTELNQTRLMTGCFEGASAATPDSGTYHFFQVLLPR